METGAAGLLARHPWVPRRPLTVAAYHRMGEVGILTEDDRVELIEGELVAMTPIGSHHSGTVNALTYALVHAVGERGVVTVQNPVRLNDRTEPQPDFTVLKPRPDFYRSATPLADDVLLLVEVADSSLSYDRAVKLPLYARHGIPEVWIVNLAAGAVEVHRMPTGDRYAASDRVGGDGRLEPALLPGVVIDVSALLR
jgi:Uma2 family endonuclease